MYRTIGKAGAKQLVKQLGGEARYEKLRKIMPRYRYLINVAAVLSAWRLAEMLATGSLILMQDSADREVILEWLTPWVHYVPISQGLSDLVPKVKWLEENPEEASSTSRSVSPPRHALLPVAGLSGRRQLADPADLCRTPAAHRGVDGAQASADERRRWLFAS